MEGAGGANGCGREGDELEFVAGVNNCLTEGNCSLL